MSSAAVVRVLVIVIASLCAAANAATIYVSSTGSDANDGLSWAAPKKTVQAGLNSAATGEQVWVAAGTYVENITLKPHVALYGGFACSETDLSQRDWKTNVTILDGNQAGSVVTAPSGATASTRIDGFRITNGSGTMIRTETFGGGIICTEASPTIANNEIIANSAIFGGGIRCYRSAAIILRNTIAHNTGVGAGIQCEESPATIQDNTILGNAAGNSGGGVSCIRSDAVIRGNTIDGNMADLYGGGISCVECAPAIVDNTITRNLARYGWGGGIDLYYSTSSVLQCLLAGNVAGEDGGAIHCFHSAPTLTNTVFTGNIADRAGGGIYIDSDLTIAGCTFAGNRANGYLGGAIHAFDCSPRIRNTIVALNTSGIYGELYSSLVPWYNCVYGNATFDYSGISDPTGTVGNILANPLFVRPPAPGPDNTWGTADDDYGDLHLLPGSPCINAGDPTFVPTAGEMDFDGQPRKIGSRVDIGADEFCWTGDTNFDGYVNVGDLQLLVAAWGTQKDDPNYNPAADCNSDSVVNAADLQLLVANWGKST